MSFAPSQIDFRSLAHVIDTSRIATWDSVPSPLRSRIEQAVAPNTSIGGVVYPETLAELAAVVTLAAQQEWFVLPCGAGSKLDWGGLVDTGRSPLLLVSTARMQQLIEHAVGDLTVTVEAGMRFADLQAALALAGQFLAIDPLYPDHATIGGIVATADAGSLRQRYNSVRDMLLGLTIVRTDGQVAKAGGRVVKNVAGYDLMKLFTGAYGTLGIISQVTFRVYPLPEASQTVILSGDVATIAQAAKTILQSALTPTSLDWLSPAIGSALALPPGTSLAVRFQSILPSVQQQVARAHELAQTLGLTVTDGGEDDAALWQRVRSLMVPEPSTTTIFGKIGIAPSETTALLQSLDTLPPDSWFLQVHAASGLGRLRLDGATPATITQIRAVCQRHRGFLSILQAPVALKQAIDVWGDVGNALDLMRQLKQQFDPQTRFSPHRFVGGI